MALPLFLIGGTIVRAVAPRIVKEIIKRGGKQVSKQAADKITKNPPTVTNVNKIPRPTIRTASGVKDFKPLPRAAGTRKAGPKAGEVKVKPSTSVATPKGNTKVAKRVQDLVAAARTSPAKPRSSSVAVPKPRPTKPSMRNITPPKRTLPSAPPKRPIPNSQRVANMGKQAIASGAAVSMIPNKKEGPKTAKASPAVTGPKPRPQVQGPPKAKAKPQGDARYRPGKGGQVMPKKFDGGYNSKTQRLVNITIDGKKSTYEIPKGMTTKQATNLLKGTVKKKAGGTPGKTKRPMAVKGASGYTTPKKKQMVSNPEYFKASNRAAEKNVGAKNVPKKVKGFSKLPEAVQKKMNPKLAAKYEAGGYLSKDRATKKLEAMKKTPKKKLARSKPLKGGGSVGSSKVARQVKGFGAARKPKK